MILLASKVFVLGAIVTAVFWPAWAWIALAVPLCWIFVMWLTLRAPKLEHVSELSDAANEFLRKFAHFYMRPLTGAAYSSASTVVAFGSIVVAVIGAFHGFWWGLAIGLVGCGVAVFLARQFNPTQFFIDDRERAAHAEIVALMRRDLPKIVLRERSVKWPPKPGQRNKV